MNRYDYRHNNNFFIIYYLNKASRYIFFLFLTIAYIVMILTYIFNSMYIRAEVSGLSMLPTFNNYEKFHEDEVFINNRVSEFDYSDIIVISDDNEIFIIKRLIAKGGDELKLINLEGEDYYFFYRNGEKLDEYYINNREDMDENYKAGFENFANSEYDVNKDVFIFTVPDDEYFYLGDNRANSQDSMSNGETVTKDKIVGRVDIILRKDDSFFMELLRNFTTMIEYSIS